MTGASPVTTSSAISQASRPSPTPMPRTQTLPNLPLLAKGSKGPPPPIQTSDRREMTEEEKSEICLSPSWSDFGGAKRKKDKKRREKEQKKLDEERKITQKGIKKELEKQRIAMMKEQKRLSKKPPPAAMETQRMPAALRRNSVNSIKSFLGSGSTQDAGQSSPEEKQRRERRWSFGSNKSKQSTPAQSDDEGSPVSEWKPIVSSNAPQLPKLTMGWHSRNTSSGSDRARSRNSEDRQGKDFFKFAYRLDTKLTPPKSKADDTSNQQPQSSIISSPRQDPLRLRGLSRSQTDSQLPTLGMAKPLEQPPETADEKCAVNGIGIGREEKKESDFVPRIRQSPSQRARDISASRGDMQRRVSVDKPDQPPMDPLRAHPIESSRPKDGGSYVHKQRMYQQQRSIQGYEDEQAVIAANLSSSEGGSPQPEQGSLSVPASTPPVASSHGTSILNRPRPPKIAGTLVVKTAKAQLHESPVEIQSAKGSMLPPTPRDKSWDNKGDHRGSSKYNKADDSYSSQTTKDEILTSPRDTPPVGQKVKRKSSPPPPRSKHKGALQRPSVPHLSQSSTHPPPLPPNKPLESPKVFLRPDELDRASLDPASPAEHELFDRRRTIGDMVLASPNAFANHSRTRTSSSQLLHDPEFLPKKTELFLPPTPTFPGREPLSVEIKSPPTSQPKMETTVTPSLQSTKIFEDLPKPLAPTPRQNTDPGPSKPVFTDPIQPTAPSSKSAVPEVIVETTAGDGVVRKTSIKRPRSNPQLNTIPPTPNLPSWDFLPQLKHQPLPKPRRQSQSPQRPLPMSLKTGGGQEFPLPPTTSAGGNTADPRIQPRSPRRLTPTQSPTSSTSDLPPAKPRLRPPVASSNSSNALTSRNSAFGPLSTGRGAPGGLEAKPLAKLFVICCKCKFWHDLPSKLYAAMSAPQMLSRDIPAMKAPQKAGAGQGEKQQQQQQQQQVNGKPVVDGAEIEKGAIKTEQAQLDTMVKCPWCEHLMTTWCCAGWTTVVYLHERHH